MRPSAARNTRLGKISENGVFENSIGAVLARASSALNSVLAKQLCLHEVPVGGYCELRKEEPQSSKELNTHRLSGRAKAV